MPIHVLITAGEMRPKSQSAIKWVMKFRPMPFSRSSPCFSVANFTQAFGICLSAISLCVGGWKQQRILVYTPRCEIKDLCK